MQQCLIDCCSLLNLMTAWRGLKELRFLPSDFYVCSAIIGESEYVREWDGAGGIVNQKIDLTASLSAGWIQCLSIESEAETEAYVSLASDVDDGEAQSMAIALNRRMVLVTDDRKPIRIAASLGLETRSTASVLREWATIKNISRPEIDDTLRRVSELARFSPPRSDPDYVWWTGQTSENQ